MTASINERITWDVTQWQPVPVFGVAGNAADHLAQAGEKDLAAQQSSTLSAPLGLFAIYLPGQAGYLGTFPLSHHELCLMPSEQDIRYQAELELCALLDVTYDDNGLVQALVPKAFGLFNDFSIRHPHTPKLSQRKNWGKNSAGIAREWLLCDGFNANAPIDDYHLLCLLKQGEQWHEYGLDSPVRDYQYFYDQLIHWMIDTFRTQGDHGAFEPLSPQLAQMHNPTQIIVALGATRYSDYAQQTALQAGDELCLLLYPASQVNQDELVNGIISGSDLPEAVIALHQSLYTDFTQPQPWL